MKVLYEMTRWPLLKDSEFIGCFKYLNFAHICFNFIESLNLQLLKEFLEGNESWFSAYCLKMYCIDFQKHGNGLSFFKRIPNTLTNS